MEGIKFVGEIMEIVLISSGSQSSLPITYVFLSCVAYCSVQRIDIDVPPKDGNWIPNYTMSYRRRE
jgi:hypothetical protein